jgi:hypothetical protein
VEVVQVELHLVEHELHDLVMQQQRNDMVEMEEVVVVEIMVHEV